MPPESQTEGDLLSIPGFAIGKRDPHDTSCRIF